MKVVPSNVPTMYSLLAAVSTHFFFEASPSTASSKKSGHSKNPSTWLALLVLAIAPFATAADAYKIAVIPKGTTHEFWKSIHAGAVKAERELKAQGVNVQIIWKDLAE